MNKTEKLIKILMILFIIYISGINSYLIYNGYNLSDEYKHPILVFIFHNILPILINIYGCFVAYNNCHDKTINWLKNIVKSINILNYITDFIAIEICLNMSVINIHIYDNLLDFNILRSIGAILISMNIAYKVIKQYELNKKLNII